MAIVDEFTPAVRARPAVGVRLHGLGAGWAAFARAIAAGWRAAAYYRQLSAMSDRQLGLRGLSRGDVPREIHRRHFASLGGGLDATG